MGRIRNGSFGEARRVSSREHHILRSVILIGDKAVKGKNKIKEKNYKSHRNERDIRHAMPSLNKTTIIHKARSTKEVRSDQKNHPQTNK